MGRRWQDEDGDWWTEYSHRVGHGFSSQSVNVSEEYRQCPYKKEDGSEPSIDELCQMWEDMDYDPLEDTIGSD